MQDLKRTGKRWKAKHVLMAIDACFSGYSLVRAQPPAHSDQRYWELLTKSRAIQVITAGTKEQPVLEEDGHGVFTAKMIQGLQGHADQNRDGMIPLMELAGWMHKRVAQASDYKQDVQYGNLDGSGQFVFTLPTKSLAYQNPFGSKEETKGETIESWIGSHGFIARQQKIRAIIQGSPAEIAGLKVDDVIQQVNQQTIHNNNVRDMGRMISELHPDRRVSLTVWRKGQVIQVPLWPMRVTSALALLQENCEKDDARSCAELGSILVKGKGAKKNNETSRKFLQKSCDLNDWLGCLALAQSPFIKRISPTMKRLERYRLMKKACDLAPTQACGLVLLEISSWSQWSFNKAKDKLHKDKMLEEILPLSRKACEHGDIWSCYSLYDFSKEAKDTTNSKFYAKQLVELVTQQCENGDYLACFDIGEIYHGDLPFFSSDNILKFLGGYFEDDFAKAQTFYTKACKLGYRHSCEASQKIAKEIKEKPLKPKLETSKFK
jgi:TPR repeat protein